MPAVEVIAEVGRRVASAQLLRQLADVRGDAARLVAGEQLGR